MPEPVAQIEAAHSGERDVQHDQLGNKRPHPFERQAAVGDVLNFVAFRCEVVAQHLGKRVVVLYNQDSLLHNCCVVSTRYAGPPCCGKAQFSLRIAF